MSEEFEKDTVMPEAEHPKAKRKNKKDEEIEKLKVELENEHNLLLRTAAEFDNFKKRTERERISVAEFAKANVIKQLLPVLDNIERSAGIPHDSEDYIKGIELIVKQLLGITEKLELKPLAAVGEPFNPELHEAAMHIEDENLGENTVSMVLQQGYKLGDTVIRPAMVQVAN